MHLPFFHQVLILSESVIVVLINMFRLCMGAHANPQKIWLKASTRPHTVYKYCPGGAYKRLLEQCPFGAARISLMRILPPLTKGMEVFLRFTYAPIPKLFNDLQSERYFENRYNNLTFYESFTFNQIQ
jgi:hypothetical protein